MSTILGRTSWTLDVFCIDHRTSARLDGGLEVIGVMLFCLRDVFDGPVGLFVARVDLGFL